LDTKRLKSNIRNEEKVEYNLKFNLIEYCYDRIEKNNKKESNIIDDD